jgi:acetyl-CoA carboxylase biotin carboxylase subunit
MIMFRKVLVANRGEIAVRVIRTLKEMGIKSVAVYSNADIHSLHVQYADESFNIGPPLARKSYLNVKKLIDVASNSGAEAIHPGYGFLAESAVFAEQCEKMGIAFIGPTSNTQQLAGEKIEALKRAKNSGVPVLPGSNGSISSVGEALKIADHIGYPVILKASGGGGGKGMRIAYGEEELKEFIRLSIGEARAAFGNPEVYVEKYLERPRHIEFQILADKSGNCVHLGERECSIQRNYQKLIEESPSPFLDEELRGDMGEAAIRVMRSVGYTNAGTVEFLVDENKNFYFNEINSRLQVEHPVTEMVTGIDLVRQQILLAYGNQLALEQDKIYHNGWSIECRINAEDPFDNFKPCPGKVAYLILPGGPSVRIDSSLYAGYEVPPFYDSLVGKLIVWAETRSMAIKRMQRALSEFIIEGIETTIPFHEKVMVDKDFIEGNISTHFLMEKFRY